MVMNNATLSFTVLRPPDATTAGALTPFLNCSSSVRLTSSAIAHERVFPDTRYCLPLWKYSTHFLHLHCLWKRSPSCLQPSLCLVYTEISGTSMARVSHSPSTNTSTKRDTCQRTPH